MDHRFSALHRRLRRRGADRLLYGAARALVTAVVRARFRIRVVGSLPSGGCILTPNHHSGWDALLLASLSPRPAHVLAKQELFSNPLLARLLVGLGAVPVQARHADAEALETLAILADAGEDLMIFPEGVRVRNGLGSPKRGAARTAIEAGVPMVPIAIRGTSKSDRRLRRSPVCVVIGDPIHPSTVVEGRASTPEAAAELTDLVWAEVETQWESIRR